MKLLKKLNLCLIEMKKKEVENIYKNFLRELKKYNQYYYNESNPLVSDSDYDTLKQKIISLENQYKYLKSKDSPSNVIGYKPSKNFKKAKHKVPMLSLSNAFSEDDLINFEKRILNFLSKEKNFNISYTAEPKIDGISASLSYKSGKLICGLSRGDGKEGEDITSNLMTIKDIPKFINSKDFPEEIDIRGRYL